MIEERFEPKGLEPDTEPCGDFYVASQWRANAEIGSARLLSAILRSQGRRIKLDYRPRIEKRYGTWSERQAIMRRIEGLQRTVASHFGLRLADMTADRGPRQITEKRQIAMYLAREVIGASYPLIAACFDKDHSTVIYGHDAVASNPRLKAAAAEVRARLAS